jgi:mRNA interferase MazF
MTLSTIVVCPTSVATLPATFHPEIVIDDQPTRVMCEMVGAVDSRALGERVAHLRLDELRAVEQALELVLDL